MDNRGVFVFAVSVFIFLVIGSVFIFAVERNSSRNNGTFYFENSKENLSCVCNDDCDNNQSCTLHYCDGGFCKSTEVVLCYQNDGCCPSGCTSDNDNDC